MLFCRDPAGALDRADLLGPAFVSPWATFAYVLVVLIVLRGSFSAFALPYAALGAELSRDYAERSVA